MTATSAVTPSFITTPLFQQEAEQHAVQLMNYTTEELQQMLKCNAQIAAENKLRYHHFFEPQPRLVASLSYTGMAYRHLRAADFTAEETHTAQQHLWITSFLYGLLRPMDVIKNYRLEGNVTLPSTNGQRLFDFWKPLLTDVLIRSVQQDDGILVNLASEEMKGLFDWKRVQQELTVVQPEFAVYKGDRLKTIVVYAKMCRGAMARYIIAHQPKNITELYRFQYEGFEYNEALSTEGRPHFTLG